MITAYFSATGTTKKAAEKLAAAAGSKLIEIVPVQKYTRQDLDWTSSNSRSSREMKDPQARPAIKNSALILEENEPICIGFPNWWNQAPRIISAFIEANDLSGHPIILFQTSGGSGIEYAVKQLKQSHPGLQIKGGIHLAKQKDYQALISLINA